MILIRFNKTRGMEGRGTVDHVWRVFDNDGKEYLVRNVRIDVSSRGEKTGEDWSIVCEGKITIEKETSTIIVTSG